MSSLQERGDSPVAQSVSTNRTLPTTAFSHHQHFDQRRRALTTLLGLAGYRAELVLGGSGSGGVQTTRAQLRSWAADYEHIHVAALETPIGTLPEALLRGSDVVQVTVQLRR